ncbi:3-oxoacyl-[acyl-carrier-protein] reductase [candidate division BRC1 bacterium HGW-BRC1-1]|nr:MAG: 3-oxoacyl-[acyl-carrier-protein] reductase [candidate division BRC1 bacterium HGW-BRC1-1]
MTSLEGKTAVVTGGSRGIGRAITEAFLRAGADVVVNYNKTPVDELKALAAELGRQLVDVQADVSQTADCERLIEAAMSTFKKVDVLVNNAGITRDTLLMRMDEAAWDAVIATNLKSVFSTCRAAVKPMIRARAGSIINISSVSGIMGNAGQCNYAASKAGVIGFSKSLAREVAARGVRVNVVAPGFITSDMTDGLDEKIREKVLHEIPLGRFGQPADIANAVLFLASDLSGFVTGHTMVVDGGMAM